MKAAHIKWVDSVTTYGWQNKETNGPSVIETVGWVVHETKAHIAVTTSASSGGRFLDQVVIPKSCITTLKRINLK